MLWRFVYTDFVAQLSVLTTLTVNLLRAQGDGQIVVFSLRRWRAGSTGKLRLRFGEGRPRRLREWTC